MADSLAAIKKCVYEDKLITKKQLLAALAADFEGDGHQKVRRILLSAPKYGNDNDYVDLIARDVYSMLDRELAQIDGCYGAKYVQAPHILPDTVFLAGLSVRYPAVGGPRLPWLMAMPHPARGWIRKELPQF